MAETTSARTATPTIMLNSLCTHPLSSLR